MLVYLSLEIYAAIKLSPLAPDGFVIAGLVLMLAWTTEAHFTFALKVYIESKTKPKGIFDDYLKALLERRG
jgi:hypothetical protein